MMVKALSHTLKSFVVKHPFRCLFFLFVFSRLLVLALPPPYYSDVKADYERYANMWWYGMEPYLEHYYEYPPVTIPFLILPLLLDQLGIGRYYPNYRVIIFLFELGLFVTLWRTIKRLTVPHAAKLWSLSFYIAAGLVAKNYWYEGIDLLFAGSLAMGLCSLVLLHSVRPARQLWHRVVFWFFFWFSVGLKFMSLPLVVIFALARRLPPQKEIVSILIGFALVFLGPGLWYRSSLQVSYVFHKDRPLKYSSVGSYVIELANHVTHREVRNTQPPDFAMEGPISLVLNRVVQILFPLSIIGVLCYGGWLVLGTDWWRPWRWITHWWQSKEMVDVTRLFPTLIHITLIYVVTIFMTAKVFSQPFPIWLVVLSSLYPFRLVSQQLRYYGLVVGLLLIMTNPYIKLPLLLAMSLPITLEVTLQTIRIGLMMVLWSSTVRLAGLESKHLCTNG